MSDITLPPEAKKSDATMLFFMASHPEWGKKQIALHLGYTVRRIEQIIRKYSFWLVKIGYGETGFV